MRLVYEKTGAEVKVGDTIKVERRDQTVELRVDYFAEPHKPSSSGKVTVMESTGGTSEYFVGVIGAKWIEREDQKVCPECDMWADGPNGECINNCDTAPATPLMRNGKPLKTLPDGAPRRMADGKNAWRKMNDAQRFEFLKWITHGEDAPVTDAAHEIMGHAAPTLGSSLIGEK